LSLSNDEIVKKLEDFDQEAGNIKKRLYELCWYMRGGISYAELVQLPIKDFLILNDIIKNNLEVTKKSGLPFF
jgi:hypothetical protein